MQLTRLAWVGGLLGLAQGYGYGSSGLSTGTDPSSSVPSTSAPYGNYTSSYYYPPGTAPYSTGSSSTSADPSYSYPSGTVGTIASTGYPSGSGKLTYTAPTGIPTEYYLHHKKPKRNAFYRGLGYQA